MVLFEIAMIILAIGLFIALSLKFFWIAALVILYRTVSSIIPYQTLVDNFSFDNHLVYFLLVMSISGLIHFGVIILTREWAIFRFVFYILIGMWVLYYYDLSEIFLLSDWMEMRGFEWSTDWFKGQFKDLVQTSPKDFFQLIVDFINGLAGGIEDLVNGIFGSEE